MNYIITKFESVWSITTHNRAPDIDPTEGHLEVTHCTGVYHSTAKPQVSSTAHDNLEYSFS